MGNRIDWTALPILVALYDLDDVDGLIERLVVIRDRLAQEDDQSA